MMTVSKNELVSSTSYDFYDDAIDVMLRLTRPHDIHFFRIQSFVSRCYVLFHFFHSMRRIIILGDATVVQGNHMKMYGVVVVVATMMQLYIEKNTLWEITLSYTVEFALICNASCKFQPQPFPSSSAVFHNTKKCVLAMMWRNFNWLRWRF